MYQNKYNNTEQIKALIKSQKTKLLSMPFNPDDYLCTEEESIAIDKELGKASAARWIAFSCKMKSKKKQLRELYWVCEVETAFLASSIYALPLLLAEIERIEGKQENGEK